MGTSLHYFSIDKTRFEQLMNFLPYPFLIAELRGDTYQNLLLNKKFDEEIGYTLDEIPTIDHWFDKAYPDEVHRQKVIDGWKQKVIQSKNEDKDFALTRVLLHTKTHGDRWYEIKASILGAMHLVAFVDIHEEVIREEELAKLNAINTTTLSILSHDLRSPLINLHTLTELVLNGELSKDEFIEMIQTLNEKSTRVLDLLNTTLLWAKSNFDKVVIRKEEVNVIEMVNKILAVYESAYRNKKLSIHTMISPIQPVTDQEILAALLRNLISNAIKFTPDGGSIKIYSDIKDDNYFLSVTDTGVGLTRKMLDLIQLENYSSEKGTRQEHGHGIGLKLCRQLLNRINGKMEMESEPGKGTTVTIIL